MSKLKRKRTFRILPAEITPEGAVTWQTPQERRQVLRRWRRMVCKRFNSRRVLRIAWVLSDLFNTKTGFSHASDRYLGAEVALRDTDVEKALAALDRGKAIIRVHRMADGRARRHIYPAGGPAIVAGTNPPLRNPPLRRDRYRKKERHYAAASTKEAIHEIGEAWRREEGLGKKEDADA